jgi:hypothetical protein
MKSGQWHDEKSAAYANTAVGECDRSMIRLMVLDFLLSFGGV